MAKLGSTFKSSSVPPSSGGDFALIPAGTQVMGQLVQCDLTHKFADGFSPEPGREFEDAVSSVCGMRFDVLDGPYARRVIWPRITVQHKESAQAHEIGQRQLAELCRAVGIEQLEDTDELLFKPVLVTVGIETDKRGQYPDRNSVKKWAAPQPPSAAPARSMMR